MAEIIGGSRSRAPVSSRRCSSSRPRPAEILRRVREARSTAAPVLEEVAARALKRLDARSASVLTLDGGLLHEAALATADPDALVARREILPRPPAHDMAAGRTSRPAASW